MRSAANAAGTSSTVRSSPNRLMVVSIGRRGAGVDRLRRGPAAGGVGVERDRGRVEGIDQRLDDAPRLVDLVLADEQRRVAEESVEQDSFVGFGCRFGETPVR